MIEILDWLRWRSEKYFSIFDLISDFYEIHEQRGKAFTVFHSQYKFNILFNLEDVLATFQRPMDKDLSGLEDNEMSAYLDIIVIFQASIASTMLNSLSCQINWEKPNYNYSQTNSSF